MQQPRALYVHIPFCLRKCPYCDFYSVAGQPECFGPYVDALRAELRHVSADIGPVALHSIFVGGGTPTVLPTDQLVSVLDACRASFRVQADAEVTCECNPGTVDASSLARLRAAGINRLSIGAQSFSDGELRFLGRVHMAEDGSRAARDVREAGFENLSLDLLYCLPGQTVRDWEENLRTALALRPTHVSAYCLQVEPGTPLARRVAAGEIAAMAEDHQAELYRRTGEVLSEGGLQQYEVSNYAMPGLECRHNLTYWRNQPYIGIGASAWSFVAGERRQNAPDVATYTEAWTNGRPCTVYQETCSGAAAANETLMMGLRMREGVSLSAFQATHGLDLQVARRAELDRLRARGLISLGEDRLLPEAEGMALLDEITTILAFSEEEWPQARRRKRLREWDKKQPERRVMRL